MNRLGALVYDRFVMRRSQVNGLAEIRREALAEARGDVLEIGAGTGLNLAAYPREGITRLVLTEPNHAMARQIEAKTPEAPVPVEVIEAPAERLPFEDATFDTVTGTLVLCETPDQGTALGEIARVLRPGGRYLFVEHVLSEDPGLARTQRRWAGLWLAFSGGCHCDRTTLDSITGSGLDVERVRHGSFPKSPKLVKPLITGAALRADVL